ncbi:chaplin [Streptomyces sp. NPDC048665]|uniref:chaplin n=1 Tax=Streptomyces sp. NPDC048665 TaxID=3155490 RepID=UPI003436AA8C
MRLRSFATTAVLAGFLAVGGSATAFAAGPGPTTGTADNPGPTTGTADNPGPTTGTAGNSPGVVSGDVIQVPIGIDANVCGDTIDLIGLLNPASGNTCSIK